MNERVVEIPWVMERLGHPRSILDVGSAGAEYHAALIESGAVRIVALDTHAFRVPHPIEMAVMNAGAMPVTWSDRFDVVTCISVLDHVGLEAYGNAAEAGLLERVIDEMWRVLAPGGRLLVTVPLGRAQVTTHPGGGQRVFSMPELFDLFGTQWRWNDWAAYRWQSDRYDPIMVSACADAGYLGDRAEAVMCLELGKDEG